MPVELTIQPKPEKNRLDLLSRKAKSFDDKLEKRQSPSDRDILALGTQLWSLLADSLDGGLDAVLAAREQALANQTFVRLNLLSEDAAVQNLPWEMTFHADERLQFLARNPDFTLVRRSAEPDDKKLDLPAKPLRILLFIASPEDLDPEKSRLDFEAEENALFSQLDEAISNGEAVVDVAEDGALKTLENWLRRETYHVIHLSMHGKLEETGPVLSFEDETTGLHCAVTPRELLDALKTAQKPAPCVTLSACQTARADAAQAIPSFARALADEHIPLVIGMRRSVGDAAATHFAAEMYRQMSAGHDLDRAVTEARRNLPNEVTLQWSIPVLHARKTSLAWHDPDKAPEEITRTRRADVQIGDLLVKKDGFIGRRAFRRRWFRQWAQGRTPHLMIHGMGGAGKTAVAGHFAMKLQQEQPTFPVADEAAMKLKKKRPELRIFAFTPPFDLVALEQQLHEALFDLASKDELEKLQLFEGDARLRKMLDWLTARQNCLFIFDNLEDALDLQTRTFTPGFSGLKACLNAVLALGDRCRALLTCRYPTPDLEMQNTELPDATLGDILRFMRDWQWPAAITPEDKRDIHRALGGNFRSIEWASGLLCKTPETWAQLEQKFDGLTVPDDAPLNNYSTGQAAVHTVREAMRQNLLFDQLWRRLDANEQNLLQQLCLETRPLIVDGARALWEADAALENALQRLNDYSLLDAGVLPLNDLPTWQTPPLVKTLLADRHLPPEAQKQTRARLARHWQFMGKNVTRLISDDLAAIEHFEAAALQSEADALTENLSSLFFNRQNFAQALTLLLPMVERLGEKANWEALNRLGQIFHYLGKFAEALHFFQIAHRKMAAPGSQEEKKQLGTTLNNISQIYDARGDYDAALDYLEKSLKIRQEIGDRAGEGTTLNNISQIFKARGDYDAALDYLEKSLAIQQEIGDRAGMIPTLHNMAHIHQQNEDWQGAVQAFLQALQLAKETQNAEGLYHVSRDLGSLLCRVGQKQDGLALLQQALAVGEQVGFPDVDQVRQLIAQYR